MNALLCVAIALSAIAFALFSRMKKASVEIDSDNCDLLVYAALWVMQWILL